MGRHDNDHSSIYMFAAVFTALAGDTLWKSSEFIIACDGKILIQKIYLLESTIALWFGMYHCLHIEYPKGLQATMDFVQR